ncbi:MAG: hypothetical protein M3O71_13470 [Bacteroidota bacterium]|nr:hypothetical protein [Bacteroidota bacterium]
MKINLSIFILLTSPIFLSAQPKILSDTQISARIQQGLSNNYHPDSVALSRLCRRACIFIKFKVDRNKQIVNLSYSKDSISFIKEALTKAVNLLRYDPELIETLRKSGKTVVQPFMYYYQAGCNFPNVLSQTQQKKEDGKSDNKKSYFEIRDDMEFFGATLWDMLNFDDGKLDALDCLILSPIRVSSGGVE